MRVPMIAGNWKMNTGVAEAFALVSGMLPALSGVADVEAVVCPPFISLVRVHELLAGSRIKLGAQNAHYEEKGAFTGEVSPAMLKGICEYVIIGHSERRQYFCEDNALLNKKLRAAAKWNLKPIFCVGERADENEKGLTEKVLSDQVSGGLAGLEPDAGFVVAYEPVWAIGTGKAASGELAESTISFIRRKLAGLWGNAVAGQVRILYGGSVTAANIAEFVRQPNIDGALVGGASLKAGDFTSIVEQTRVAKKTA